MEIRILNCNEDALYTFRYKGIRRVVCEKPPHQDFSHADDFGDLLGYQLTAVDKDYLRHECEFASGAPIIIEFRRLIFRRQPIRRHYSLIY